MRKLILILIFLLFAGDLVAQSSVSAQGSMVNIYNTIVRRDPSGDIVASTINAETGFEINGVPLASLDNVLWVDISFSAVTSTGSINRPYSTISAALTASTSGDLILVVPGVYSEHLAVTQDSISIIGVGGAEVTFLEALSSGGTGIALVDYTLIKGFHLTTDAAGAIIELNGGENSVQILDNVINSTGSGTFGISVGASGSDSLLIQGNTFKTNSGDGAIWLQKTNTNTVVDNNFFFGSDSTSGYAIQTAGINVGTFSNNVIDGYASGIFVHTVTSGTAGSYNVLIEGNTIKESAKAIRLGHASQSTNMDSIFVVDNTLHHNNIGVHIADDATILANTFEIIDNRFLENTSDYTNDHSTLVPYSILSWSNGIDARRVVTTAEVDETRHYEFLVDGQTDPAASAGVNTGYFAYNKTAGSNGVYTINALEGVARSSYADEAGTFRGVYGRTYTNADATSTMRTAIGGEFSARASYSGGTEAVAEGGTAFVGSRIWMAPYFTAGSLSNINNFHGLWLYNEHTSNSVTNAIFVDDAGGTGGWTNGLNFNGATIGTSELIGSQGEKWENVTTDGAWTTDATVDITKATTVAGGERGINLSITHDTNPLTGTLMGGRLNARVDIDSPAGSVTGLEVKAGNTSVGYDISVVRGVYSELVNKTPSGATTWDYARAYEANLDLNQGSAGNVNTITNAAMFYGNYNLPTVGTYATVTNGYGVKIRNEAVGGTGQMLDAGFYLDDLSHSGGIYGWDFGIDFSGIGANSGRFGTADIRGALGELWENSTVDGRWTTDGGLTVDGDILTSTNTRDIGSSGTRFNRAYFDTVFANVYTNSDFVLGESGFDVTVNADTLKGAPVWDGALVVTGTITLGTDLDLAGDIYLDATKKVIFADDADDHTYILESGADVLDTYVGGVLAQKITESTTISGVLYDVWDVTGALTANSMISDGVLQALGAFTSLGIDDNATSNAITIEADEDVILVQNLALVTTKEFLFDGGGGHTKLAETSDDVLDVVIGGESMILLTEATPNTIAITANTVNTGTYDVDGAASATSYASDSWVTGTYGTFTLGAAEKFYIDASSTEHTQTAGALDIDVKPTDTATGVVVADLHLSAPTNGIENTTHVGLNLQYTGDDTDDASSIVQLMQVGFTPNTSPTTVYGLYSNDNDLDYFVFNDGTAESRFDGEVHFANNAAAATFGLQTTDADVVVAFDGTTNQGSLTYMEDEDRFDFDNDISVGGNIAVGGTVDGIDIATDVAANTTHRGSNGTDHSLLGATPGTATASIALIVDANKDIDLGTGDLLATELSGTLQTAAQTNVTSLGTLTALAVDNLLLDGNDISSTSGALTINTANDDEDAFIYGTTGTIFHADADIHSVGIGGNSTTTARLTIRELVPEDSSATILLYAKSDNAANYALGSLLYWNQDVSDDGPTTVAQIQGRSVNANGSGGQLVFKTHDGTEGGEGSDPVERMRIDGSGDVTIQGSLTVIGASTEYGEMYLNANGNPTTIETASTPISVKEFTTGALSGWTFDAGGTGAVIAYYDRGANVGVHDDTHGLSTSDIISIRGTTDYNGIFSVTVVDADSFYIADTWNNDNGASDWDEASHLIAGADAAGTYKIDWDMSGAEGGGAGSTVTYVMYVNTTAQAKTTIQRKFANNDVGAFGGHGLISISVSDKVFLTANSSGTNPLTHSYGALVLEKL